jgi:diadenosine tetraphosphatase ApaH/serine/threonine PP2A family protein phosphatase
MKIALLSDLHANLQATRACLDDARAQGATHFAFLGDLVGYGADPGPVVDIVMQMAEDEGAWVVRGNHDEAALHPRAGGGTAESAGAGWTHQQLSPTQRSYLASLPLTARQGPILMAHANAHEPARWDYVTGPRVATLGMDIAYAEGVTHVFCGHVHEQRLFYDGAKARVMAFEPTPGVPVPVLPNRRWLATIGSVGQPRDGRTQAMYASFDAAAWRLTFHRVRYDHAAAAAAIRRAGLPAANAERLALGR